MPSFSNAGEANGHANGNCVHNEDVKLADIVHCSAVDQILRRQRDEARTRARQIIQQDIPTFINHIVKLIDQSENDPTSIFHANRIKEGGFVALGVGLISPTEYGTHGSGAGESKSTQTIPDEKNGHPESSDSRPTGHTSLNSTDPPASEPIEAKPVVPVRWVINGQAGGAAKRSFGRDIPDEEEGMGARWLGGLKSNEVCGQMLEVLDAESEMYMTWMKDLIHFIHMQTPTMEDGNNFGVEVQEHVFTTLDRTLGAALKLHGLSRSHYSDRMDLASSWNRYPNLEDHAAAIAASDRFDRFLVINAFRTLRNNATTVLRAMRDNWPKVSDPKGLEAGSGGNHHAMGMY